MDFNNYKFRAHSIGNIMSGLPKPLTENQESTYNDFTERKNGNGRPLTDKQLTVWADLHKKKNAEPELTNSSKKWLEQLVWEELTGRSTAIKSKYLDKGIQSEEKSLTLYSSNKESLVLKNKERKNNDFFTGECDIARYKVRDIKSSWSFQTFPLTSVEIPNKDYEWQLDVYMDLFDYKRAELIYCLVDTPFKLIEDELRRLDWKFNIMDMAGDIRKEHIGLVVETVSNLLFTFKGVEDFCKQSSSIKIEWFNDFKEIPEELRIKIFKMNYCEKRNSQLKQMVQIAREYMNYVLEDIGEYSLKFQELKKAM